MRAAYNALMAQCAQRGNLSAYHSLTTARGSSGTNPNPAVTTAATVSTMARAVAPLVKVHPETGRKSLVIGRHAHNIPGMDKGESSASCRSWSISRANHHALPSPVDDR